MDIAALPNVSMMIRIEIFTLREIRLSVFKMRYSVEIVCPGGAP
jgi:hypothetical protein